MFFLTPVSEQVLNACSDLAPYGSWPNVDVDHHLIGGTRSERWALCSVFLGCPHTAAFKLGGLFDILALFSISRVNL